MSPPAGEKPAPRRGRRALTAVIVGVVLFLAAVNVPIVSIVLGWEPTFRGYSYSSSGGNWVAHEGMKTNYGLVRSMFGDAQRDGEIGAEEQLCRDFDRSPLQFWRWRDYAFHPRWRLPRSRER